MSLFEAIFNGGRPKTRYARLSDDRLTDLYRYDRFRRLNENERLDLFQETVNRRVAAELGKGFCPVVKFDDAISEDREGHQYGSTIAVNRKLYGRSPDVSESSFDNMEALETVLHEYRHYVQGLQAAELIPCDEEKKRLYRANGNAVRYVSGERASMYLEGKEYWTGKHLYYFQPVEADAHKWSQEETMKVISREREVSGDELSFVRYEEYIEIRGYEARREDACTDLDTDNPEEQIARVLTNVYYSENKPVSADIDRLVKEDMIASRKAQDEELAGRQAAKMSSPEKTDAEKLDAAISSQTPYIGGIRDRTGNGTDETAKKSASQTVADNGKKNYYGLG